MTKAHFIGGSKHGEVLSLLVSRDWYIFPRPRTDVSNTYSELWLDSAGHKVSLPNFEYYGIEFRFAKFAVYTGEAITADHRKAIENLRWFTRRACSPAVGYALWMESCFSESLETDLTFQLRLMMLHQESGLTRSA